MLDHYCKSADRWESTGWVMISGSWGCFANVSANISSATTVPCQGTSTFWCRTGSINSACALRPHMPCVFRICGQGRWLLCTGEIGRVLSHPFRPHYHTTTPVYFLPISGYWELAGLIGGLADSFFLPDPMMFRPGLLLLLVLRVGDTHCLLIAYWSLHIGHFMFYEETSLWRD